MPRVWLALDLKRVDGPAVPASDIPELLENDLDDSIFFDDSEYEITVLGVGTNAEVEANIKLRRANAKALGGSA